MKKLLAATALATFASVTFAQLSPLPPSSVTDGVSVQTIGLNAGATHWESTSTLGAFKVDSTTSGNAPLLTSTYNPLGLPFATNVPASVLSFKSAINTTGGTIRTAFLAESAGWMNDLGYTYSGIPQSASSYTVAQNIQIDPSPSGIAFGSYFDVSLASGEAANFDLWLNGVGDFGTDPAPSGAGGAYTAFNPSNSNPYVAPGNVLWSQTPLMVSTWIPALGTYVDVATYIVAFEDWRRTMTTSDGDYSDLILAVQIYDQNGTPFTPVPEPSTYGLLGAGALLGMIALRRARSKKSRGLS
jgi:hypothetical protein